MKAFYKFRDGIVRFCFLAFYSNVQHYIVTKNILNCWTELWFSSVHVSTKWVIFGLAGFWNNAQLARYGFVRFCVLCSETLNGVQENKHCK